MSANTLDFVQGLLSKNSHQQFVLELALARAGFRFVRRHPVAIVALAAAGVAVLALLGRSHARQGLDYGERRFRNGAAPSAREQQKEQGAPAISERGREGA